MSENSTEPMAEIQEIIEDILNKPSVTKDDCAEAQAKFQMTFLTLPNKEQFIAFLNSYLDSLLQKSGSDDEKCNLVKMEIDRFYDNIPSIFSMYRIAGHKDPHDKNESEVMSKDIDSDFEDIMRQRGLDNKDDLVIPEDKKTAVARVLQNISTFADQIKTLRIQTLTKWRFLRLAKKNAELLKVFPALLTLDKFARRKYHCFFQLRKAVLPVAKGVSEHSVQNLPSCNDAKSGREKSDLNDFNEQTTKEDRNKTQRESASMASMGLDTEVAELREQLKGRDEVIKTLRDEIKRLGQPKPSSSESLSVGFEEQIRHFKNQIGELEARVMELNRDNESKKNLINDNIAQLLDQKNQIQKLTAEVKSLQLMDSRVNLNRFGKARFLQKAMRVLVLKLTQSAFNRMLKRSVRAADAIREVSLRMKARLLDQTRSLNCGNDIHRSFLKWFVRSDNKFLRDIVTKVLVNCKISHVIAVYRLKKLIHKPARNKLSDGIKMLHKSKASILLHDLFSKKGTSFKKNFMLNFNTNNKSKNEALLERLLQAVPKSHWRMAKKHVLDRLTGILATEKKVLFRVSCFWKIQQRLALRQLGFWADGRLQCDRLGRLGKGLAALQVLVARREKDFIDRAKQPSGGALSRALALLGSACRGKSVAVLAQLKRNQFNGKLEQTTGAFQARLADSKKSNLVQRMVSALRQKAFCALSLLREFTQEELRKQDRRTQLGQRVLMSMIDRMKALKAQVIKRLRNHKQRELNRLSKKHMTCELLVGCQKQKMMACLAGLTENYAELKAKELRRNQLLQKVFGKLVNRSHLKCSKAIKRLTAFAKQSRVHSLRVQARTFAKLHSMKDSLLSATLQKLLANAKARLAQQLLDEQRRLMLNKMLGWYRLPLLRALRDLREFNQLTKSAKEHRTEKMKSLFNRVAQRSAVKCGSVLSGLGDCVAKDKAEADRRKRVLGTLLGLMAQKCRDKCQRAVAGLQSNNSQLKRDSQRKDALVRRLFGDLLSSQEQKKRLGVSKLQLNCDKLRALGDGLRDKQERLFKGLRDAQQAKQRAALLSLHDHASAAREARNERNKRLKAICNRLAIASRVKSLEAVGHLRDNCTERREHDKSLRDKKLSVLNRLNALDSKKQQAFHKLSDLGRQLARDSARKAFLTRALLNKLVRASQAKKERAMVTLLVARQNDKLAQQLDRVKARFDQALLKRKQKGLLMLLVSSQMGKMAAVLAQLVKHSNMRRIEDMRQRDRNRNRIQRLVDCLKGKVGYAVEALKANKNAGVESDKLKSDRMNKLKDILGMPQRDLQSEQFVDLATQLRKPKKPLIDYNLRRLNEWMKRHNRRGVYDGLLDAIRAGGLSNMVEALGWAKQHNDNNSMSPVIARINDSNREAHDVLALAKQSNSDGCFGDFVDGLEKTPRLPKTEVVESVSRAKDSKSFKALKALVDEDKKVDELMRLMRLNNKTGRYDKPLEYLRGLSNPRLSDLLHLVAADKHSDYDDLKRQVNNEDSVLTPVQLMDVARNAKRPELYKPLVDFAMSERVPTLTDMFRFMKRNNADGRFNDFIDVINDKKQMPQLRSLVTGRLDPVQNAERADMLGKLIDWMNNNNDDGLYNEMLDHLFGLDNPKLFDLVSFANECSEESERFEDILDKMDKEFDKKRLKAMVFKSPLVYADLVTFWDSDSRLSLGDIVHIINEHNKTGVYDPVVAMINGDDNAKTVGGLLSHLRLANRNGVYDDLIERLAERTDLSMAECAKLVAADNADNRYDEVLAFINGKSVPKINDAIRFMRRNNRGNRFGRLLSVVDQRPDLLLTDLMEEVEKDNKKGSMDDLQAVLDNKHRRNLKDQAVDFMVRNNASGKFNNVLSQVGEGRGNDLVSLVGLLRASNSNGAVSEVMAVVDEAAKDQLMADVAAFAKDNNQDDRYADLLSMLRRKKNPRLSDVVDVAVHSNKTGLFDPLVEMINGNNFSVERIKDFMTRNNKDSRFNELLQLVTDQPDIDLERFVDSAQRCGPAGQMDGLFGFLNNGLYDIEPDEGDDDLFKFLAHARRQNEHPELVRFLQEGKVKNPEQLLDYLTKNNKDGQYDDVIKRVVKHMEQQADMVQTTKSKGPSLTKAVKAKMLSCVNNMRVMNQEGKLLDRLRLAKTTGLINALKAKQDAKRSFALNKLADHNSQRKALDQSKMDKLGLLYRKFATARNAKARQCLESLRVAAQNANRQALAEKQRNSAVFKQLGKAMEGKKRMAMQGIDAHKKAEADKRAAKDLKLKDLFRRLGAVSAKQAECLGQLRHNASEAKAKQQRLEDASRVLLSKLKGGCVAKTGRAVEGLREHSGREVADQRKRESAAKRVFSWMKEGRKDQLQSVLSSLKAHKDLVNATNNHKDKQKMGLLFLHKQAMKNRDSDLRTAVGVLRKHNADCNASLNRQSTALKQLIGQANKVRTEGLFECVSKLKTHKNEIEAAQQKRRDVCARLAKALGEASSEKMRRAMMGMQDLSVREGLKGRLQRAGQRGVLQQLMACAKAKAAAALAQLLHNNRRTKLDAETLRKKRLECLQALSAKARQSQAKAIEGLRNMSQQSQLEQRRRNNLASRICNKLVASCAKKQQLFLQKAHDLAFSKKSKQEIQNALLRNVFGKLMGKKLLACLEKLLLFALRARIRAMRKEAAFRQTKASSLCKNALAVGKLRHFGEVQRLKFRHNAGLLNAVFSGLAKSHKAMALGTLRQNASKLAADQTAALKFVRKQLLNKARSALDKLMGVNGQFKRNRINNAVSGMLFCLKKNHKASMRNMLDIWSQKEAKAKTKNFNAILNGLIHKRLASGFEKIKYNYNLWKHKKVLQGLMATVDKVNRIQDVAKGRALRDMYDMFIDSNPWFKKCISILAMSSKLTDQVSFWKMRVVKNLKREGVNPMQAIKLNKMAQTIKKMEMRNLNFAIWKLTQAYDISMSKSLGLSHNGVKAKH